MRCGCVRRWDIGDRWRWPVLLSVGTRDSVANVVNECQIPDLRTKIQVHVFSPQSTQVRGC